MLKELYILNAIKSLNVVLKCFCNCITIHLSIFKICLVFALYSGNHFVCFCYFSANVHLFLYVFVFLCYVLFNFFLFIHAKFYRAKLITVADLSVFDTIVKKQAFFI